MSIVISSSLVLSPSAVGNLRLPHLCVDRVRGAVSASSTAGDYAPRRADNPLTYSGWKPATVPARWIIHNAEGLTANYMGVIAPEAAQLGASLQAQFSYDGTTWADAGDPFIPALEQPALSLFESTTAPYWALRVAGAAPVVAVVQFGVADVIPSGVRAGFAPATWNPDESYTNVASEGGQILGRHLERRGSEQRISIPVIEDDWIDAHLAKIQRKCRTSGVFFAWSPSYRPQHIAYGMTTRAPSASYSQGPWFTTLDMQLEGV